MGDFCKCFMNLSTLIGLDWSHCAFTQSPYIKFTLHDGTMDDTALFFTGRGEVVQTLVQPHAGGHAKFNEKFILNKPGNFLFLFSHLGAGAAIYRACLAANMRVLRIRLEHS